jgi:RHS repeat-associated protein
VVDPNFLIRVLSAPGFQETAPEPALSTTSESIVIDLGYGFSVSEITLPVTDINLALLDDEILTVFTSLVNADEAYEQASEPVITLDTSEISIQFSQPVFTRYIKLHTSVHYMDAAGESIGMEQLVSIDSSQISVGVSTTGINEFFNYTPDGNRAAKSLFTDVLATEEYEYYSGSDRLMIAGGIAYRYDPNGNLTEQGSSYTGTEDSLTIAMSEDYRQYRYDLLNRLTEVLRYQDGNLVTVARYGYDINSLRIYKEDGQGITTHYVYDATGNRLETHSDETSSYYLFRGLRHVARRIVDNVSQEEVRHYYGTDHLGSTVLVTGDAGEVLWTGETNPFGDSVSGEGIVGESERIKYTGKDFDEDAGLYYFNARWYDPGTGRFITEDPIRYGANWYGYANNNPLMFVDPTGLYGTNAGYSGYDPTTGTGVDNGWDYNGGNPSNPEINTPINISNEEILDTKFEEWNLNLANDLNTALAEQDAILDLIRQIDPIAYADMMVMLRYGGNPELLLEGEALHLFDQYTAVTVMIVVLQQTTNGVPDAYSWMQQQGTAGRSVSEADFLATAYHDGRVKNTVQQIEQLAIAVYAGSQYGGNQDWARRIVDRIRSAISRQASPRTVIGRVSDLQNLGPNEQSLLDRLPNKGNPQANWRQNSGVLREEMARGLPIRDASPGDTGGQFLNAERNLLQSRGWTFDSSTNYWMPPIGGL